MFPPNRQLKKLWDVLEVIRNWKSCNQNKEKIWDKITRIETIADGSINPERVGYFFLSDDDKIKFSIKEGDILFSHINSPVHIWKVAIAKKDYDDLFHWMNLLLLRWKPWIINPEFLFNLLNWIFHKWEREKICKKAINQASLNQKQILEIQIPLPPLEEQKKIVAYLDELNATISRLKSEYQSQLAMLDEMRNSSLDLAFWGSRERAYNLNNWKWVKLGDVVTLCPKKSQIASISDDLKISFVPMADLSQEEMLFETKEVRTLGEVRKGYTYFEDRDVLLAKVTPCFENGKCGVARDLKNGIWFWSSEFFVFRMSESILPEYFYYFVSGKWFREEWAKNMGWAVGLQRVKQEWIKNVEIPLPDLETQSQIVAHLDQVHQQITTLKTQVNSQIEHCDELWQSSLEKVLTQGVNNEFN